MAAQALVYSNTCAAKTWKILTVWQKIPLMKYKNEPVRLHIEDDRKHHTSAEGYLWVSLPVYDGLSLFSSWNSTSSLKIPLQNNHKQIRGNLLSYTYFFLFAGVCVCVCASYLALAVKLRRTCVREDKARAPVCCTRREFSYDVSSAYRWNDTHSHHSQLNWLCLHWSHTATQTEIHAVRSFRHDETAIHTQVTIKLGNKTKMIIEPFRRRTMEP